MPSLHLPGPFNNPVGPPKMKCLDPNGEKEMLAACTCNVVAKCSSGRCREVIRFDHIVITTGRLTLLELHFQ